MCQIRNEKNKFDNMKNSDLFNFEDFEQEAIQRLKAGASLPSKGGIFTPLIKRILEVS